MTDQERLLEIRRRLIHLDKALGDHGISGDTLAQYRGQS